MEDLFHELIRAVKSTCDEIDSTDPIPLSLCNQFDRPDKQEAIEKHTSRFNQ